MNDEADMETLEKPRGLGRGLNALFEDEDNSIAAEVERSIQAEEEKGTAPRARHMIGTDQIYNNPNQPRQIFHGEALTELAESIAQYGILQPLILRRSTESPDQYEIIAGERRWRAAQLAHLHEVPAIIMDLEDVEAYKIAMVENLQREDLDPIDEAAGYQVLLEQYGQTQEELSKAVGKSRPYITNALRLLSLPMSVKGHVSLGNITAGHARTMVGLSEDMAESLCKRVMAGDMSVRQTEKMVAEAKGLTQKSRPRAGSPAAQMAHEKDADTIALENDMTNALGMRVSIDSADGKAGKLSIEFKTLDQLDELLHRLAHYPGARLSG